MAAEPLQLPLRTRGKDDGPAREVVKAWDAAKSALIICDMWDAHTCPNSAARVGELAPRVDAVAKALRARGALIIHCPSDTMKFYEGTQLMVEHVEKYWCPSTTSAAILGGKPFHFIGETAR